MRKLVVLILAALGVLLVVPAASALASAQTFYVHPSGGNDTTNIQNAFNAAVKAGTGSTVQLTAGQFYTSTIFVRNFHGCFKGAGEAKTVIDTVAGVSVSTMPSVEPFPFLIGLSGGNVCVSNMSFNITSMTPAEGWYDQWGDGPLTSLGATVLVTGSASASFDQVAFAAAATDTSDDYNVNHDIEITGAQQWLTPPAVTSDNSHPLALAPTGGVDSVTRCSFTGYAGVMTDGLTAGKLTVGGSAAQQNVFNAIVGCEPFDSSNSTIVISHNRMQIVDGSGVQFWQSFYNPATPPPPLPAPRYFVCDNDITATGYGAGVLMEDDSLFNGDTPRLDATISGNTITLDNDGWDGGIDGFMVQGAKVLDNHISGTAIAGIDVGTTFPWDFVSSPPSSGWQIIGNDVSGVTATGVQYGGVPTAQIWLGPYAVHCLVVGGCRPTTVLDQGTKDILINVTKLADPPAAAAKPMNALKQMKQLKGMMRP
jgi:hypothetical protein